MPAELIAGIDRIEANRSRFIAEAVRHELQRRQRLELLRSLDSPHPDSTATAVEWRPESGWQEVTHDPD
jgi:hypothetical protein